MDRKAILLALLALDSGAQADAPVSPSAPPAPAIPSGIIGARVVVRDNRAGVWWGVCESCDPASGVTILNDARQAHYWRGAAATAGLAARGPGDGSRITPAVGRVIMRDLITITPTTADADEFWLAAPVWTP